LPLFGQLSAGSRQLPRHLHQVALPDDVVALEDGPGFCGRSAALQRVQARLRGPFCVLPSGAGRVEYGQDGPPDGTRFLRLANAMMASGTSCRSLGDHPECECTREMPLVLGAVSPGIVLIRWLSLAPIRRDAERRAAYLNQCCGTIRTNDRALPIGIPPAVPH
jgi:hypothetical protein